MQVFIIILAIAVFAHDQLYAGSVRPPHTSDAMLVAIMIAPKLLLMLLYALFARIALARIVRQQSLAWINRIDRLSGLYRALALLLYGLDLACGSLHRIREAFGNFVLLDELVVMLPPIAMMCFLWAMYYPIERKLREATQLRRFDEGLPVYPIWTRGQYLIAQLRHQVVLLLLPLLTLMAWTEVIKMRLPQSWLPFSFALQFAGAGAVFLVMPLVITTIWDTVPLPPGSLRDMLQGMCDQHKVKVRQLLLWRTFGGMINGAVMGIIAPFRYILLTDALLDMLPKREIEAVMAHELAHVRRHHMLWLLAAMVAAAIVSIAIVDTLAKLIGAFVDLPASGLDSTAQGMILQSLVFALGLPIFGWISRRYERQADTFAAQHLSAASPTITPDAADAMISALGHVASLNHIPPARKSWRHGSIAWRQNHLRSIVGQPVHQLPIDNHVRAINLASALVILAVAAYVLWEQLHT